jgi:Asp-tRNA(Asn)/Glu-tRNA(Gln) amidotransferase A subunit family amidase
MHRLRSLHSRLVTTALGIALLAPVSGRAQSARSSSRSSFEVTEATISELQSAMASGRLTSVQLTDAYLARVAAYDTAGPALNALIRVNPRARAEAAALDRERQAGRTRGPLHGIPVILKDNYSTRDMPTSGGSLALANLQTRDDAFVVTRLREAGAIIIGKSNLHELASGITTISSLGGQTRNPYDPTRCPGGSSGGTAAAIAASFAAVGWGSDTCGSIRIPAAFNNLVGLRPTQGMTSRTGILPLSHTQDVIGPLARTVTDLAIALDVTVGTDAADSVTRRLAGRAIPRFIDSLSRDAFRGTRLGVLLNYFGADADRETLDTVRAAIRSMRSLGAEVVDVTVPGFDSLLVGTSVIDYETKWDLIDYLARTPDAPAKSLRDILDGGLFHESLEARFRIKDTLTTRAGAGYLRALERQAALRARMITLLDSLHLDALVYPTMRMRPARIGEPQLGATCQLSAHTGLPALSAPAGFTADGLPVGVELMGRPFTDARLVAMAYALEQAGTRRQAPSFTPALLRGRAPHALAYVATARSSSAAGRGDFVYDPLRSELRFDVQVSGAAPAAVRALVLRRADNDSAHTSRVVQRLLGPGMTRASGAVTLGGVDRRALLDGRLVLSLLVAGDGAKVADARILPSRKRGN